MIIFTHQEVISIHRTDIKALWKIRQKWKDIGSKPKCNNVCYIVNKLLQVVVLSYEKAITADIYQIDRDYSRVSFFFFFFYFLFFFLLPLIVFLFSLSSFLFPLFFPGGPKGHDRRKRGIRRACCKSHSD